MFLFKYGLPYYIVIMLMEFGFLNSENLICSQNGQLTYMIMDD